MTAVIVPRQPTRPEGSTMPLLPRLRLGALALCATTALTGCDDSAPHAPDDGLTAPGSVLAVGDTARVTTDVGATVDLTVTAIRQGATSDLASRVKDGDQLTPSYVDVSMTLVEGDPRGGSISSDLTAYVDGDWAGYVPLTEPFARCQERAWPVDATPGTDVTSCLTFMAEKGSTPVDSVRFTNDGDYSEGVDGQVTWQ